MMRVEHSQELLQRITWDKEGKHCNEKLGSYYCHLTTWNPRSIESKPIHAGQVK